MTLSPVRQRVVNTCTELIGKNSGLHYRGLYSDAAKMGVYSGAHEKRLEAIRQAICVTADFYGLKGLSTGELIYWLHNKGVCRIDISVKVQAKPLVTGLEMEVLEALAKVLVPRGGYFHGYLNQVCSLLGVGNPRMHEHYTRALVQRFRAKNIEQAIVSAFATGILNQHKVFGEEIPAPLAIIMNSESYRTASSQPAVYGVHTATLTSSEEVVALEFIRRLGSNGGLYSRGWYESVAAAIGRTFSFVDGTMEVLKRKLGVNEIGLAIYAASSLLREPVIVQLPPKVEAQFNGSEVEVMRESARRQLPIAGYRSGNTTEVAKVLHWREHTIEGKFNWIAKKTNTENSQQTITYFLAYGLILAKELGLDQAKTPALEAILQAASNGGRATYLR